MRVAYDSQAFTMQEYGGISRYFCSLAKELFYSNKLDIKVFSPLYINAYLSALPPDIVAGYKIPKIPNTGRIVTTLTRMLEKPAINRFRPDIVHETYYKASSSAPRNVAKVVTVYDMMNELYPAEFKDSMRITKLKRIATQRADHVICISEKTRSDLLETFDLPADKVSVIYLGFDRWGSNTQESVFHNKPYILYVGHRGGYKNFTGFVRAYASSAWLRNNFNVLCFGGSGFSRDEMRLFKELRLTSDQVTQMTGSDVQLARCYKSAALFVFPSLYEGFGIPPLEAMSQDCPVSCSNSSSIPEVVGHAGEYFDPKDPESMRAAMEYVLNSNARRIELIDNGKLRCAEFSWRRCAGQTLDIYKKFI